jgi:hypothetical protein
MWGHNTTRDGDLPSRHLVRGLSSRLSGARGAGVGYFVTGTQLEQNPLPTMDPSGPKFRM